jgi:hypothetical protein
MRNPPRILIKKIRRKKIFGGLRIHGRILKLKYCYAYVWLSTGLGLDIGFIDYFNTKLVITHNYSVIANFHTLQLTRAHTKPFPALSVFISSCLVTASNNGCSSSSVFKSSLKGGSLPTTCFFTTYSRPFNTNLLVFSSRPNYQLNKL